MLKKASYRVAKRYALPMAVCREHIDSAATCRILTRRRQTDRVTASPCTAMTYFYI